MPRNPINHTEFIAGALPTVKIGKKEYYVDGRLKELRNVNDFSDKIDHEQFEYSGIDYMQRMKKEDKCKVIYEWYGYKT